MNIQNATPAPNPIGSRLSFADALNAGDLERACACFARDGCLLTPDGTAIHGRERIRDVLLQMVIRRTEIEVELSSTIDAGAVTLASERWKIRSGETDKRRLVQSSNAILILCLVEGEWKLSLLAPWGCRHLLP